MAQLLQTNFGRKYRGRRRFKLRNAPDRSHVQPLRSASRPRLSRRASPYRPSLLYQFPRAEAGGQRKTIAPYKSFPRKDLNFKNFRPKFSGDEQAIGYGVICNTVEDRFRLGPVGS